MNDRMLIAEEVADALRRGAPVVALESTIISHGFPYPANLECAFECERRVREQGATPATIAVLGGRLCVGLERAQLEHLATAEGIAKVSRRDLAPIVASGGDGATTVAGTMVIAAMAGIRVFATGGIGGVHRGAQATMDVSADLLELAQTNVAVVCSGAKSILDLGLTLEVLETHGVPVIGYRTDEFPAFYSRTSGHGVDIRLDSAEKIGEVLLAHDSMGLGGGTIIANPIPADHEIEGARLDAWTAQALGEAAESEVHGKAVTPFLLARLHEISAGETEEANKQLVWSNCELAAQVAGEYATHSRG